jgi:hypothetical protein
MASGTWYLLSDFPCSDRPHCIKKRVTEDVLETREDSFLARLFVPGEGELTDLSHHFQNTVVDLISFPKFRRLGELFNQFYETFLAKKFLDKFLPHNFVQIFHQNVYVLIVAKILRF